MNSHFSWSNLNTFLLRLCNFLSRLPDKLLSPVIPFFKGIINHVTQFQRSHHPIQLFKSFFEYDKLLFGETVSGAPRRLFTLATNANICRWTRTSLCCSVALEFSWCNHGVGKAESHMGVSGCIKTRLFGYCYRLFHFDHSYRSARYLNLEYDTCRRQTVGKFPQLRTGVQHRAKRRYYQAHALAEFIPEPPPNRQIYRPKGHGHFGNFRRICKDFEARKARYNLCTDLPSCRPP